MFHPDFSEIEVEPGVVIYRYAPSGEYAITPDPTAPRYWALPDAVLAFREHNS